MEVEYRPLSDDDDDNVSTCLVDPVVEEVHVEGNAVISRSSTWDGPDGHKVLQPFRNAIRSFKRNQNLFAIQPVMILYGIQFAMTGSVTNQLWLDRTCSVTLGFNDTICSNLTDDRWEDYEILVQKKVEDFSTVSALIGNVPPILVALYLGPLSDKGRKLLMYVPFIAHVVSGVLPLLAVYFRSLPPQFFWIFKIHVLGGGLYVLQIAMYGYIGDMTDSENRTTFMTIVTGLAILIFPMGEVLGGQLFKYGGYYAVYGVSLGAAILGVFYIFFVPESVSVMTEESIDENEAGVTMHPTETTSYWAKAKATFATSFKSFFEAYGSLLKPRVGDQRRILWILLSISVLSSLAKDPGGNVDLFFTKKQFSWSVVDFTTFSAVSFASYAFRTFITTPILCNCMKVHDCMLAINGGLASISAYATMGLANKGWMMYYAVSLTLLGGIQSTPLQSLVSKCVHSGEYGKVFALSSVASSVAGLISTTVMPIMYKFTVAKYPGAVFIFKAGIELLTVLAVCLVYVLIYKHEKVNGPLGAEQDEAKNVERLKRNRT